MNREIWAVYVDDGGGEYLDRTFEDIDEAHGYAKLLMKCIEPTPETVTVVHMVQDRG